MTTALIQSVILTPHAGPLEAVLLPDNHDGASIRSLCAFLQIDRTSQVHRIKRNKALAPGLVVVDVTTPDGIRALSVLRSEYIALFVATLHVGRLSKEAQANAAILQTQAGQAIARAFAQQPIETEPAKTPKRAPDRLNYTSESPHASDLVRMFAAMGAALETRFTDIETRLAAREQEEQAILVRLKRLDAHVARLVNAREGKSTLAPSLDDEQQRTLVNLLWSVRRLTGEPFGQLATELAEACGVADLTDIPQPAWPEILAWVKRKMDL
jgi:hypothetical protein